MKSFLKLGSLFALIIAGRYMQSVAPTGDGIEQKAPMALFTPVAPAESQYIKYDSPTASPVLPASQRTQRKPSSLTWY